MSEINFPRIRRLDGALLLVFQELIRQRRTTIVAERLGLTQSAISHALARLREIFDDELFVRRPNGLEPTQRAQEIAPRIDELIRLIHRTLETGKTFTPATTSRHFRIGSGDFLSALVAAPLLKLFEREAPNASFAFRFLLGEQALESLHRDEIDVAVGRLPPAAPDDVVEDLYEDGYCIVARKDHPRVQGAIDLKTYAELNHVIISLTGELEQLGDTLLKGLHIERRVVAAVPRFLTAFTLVAQSDAIVTVQTRVAARFSSAFQLQLVPPPFETERFGIVAVRRNRSHNDPAVDWLIEKLREAARVD